MAQADERATIERAIRLRGMVAESLARQTPQERDRKIMLFLAQAHAPKRHIVRPEDIVLTKLDQRKNTGSRMQWENALGVVRIYGSSLNWKYLFEQARIFGVADDLTKLRDEGGV